MTLTISAQDLNKQYAIALAYCGDPTRARQIVDAAVEIATNRAASKVTAQAAQTSGVRDE